ncbi:MAG: CARDB domain-containing protein [Minisyncoccia bacterium]
MNELGNIPTSRQAATNGLAVVGFIALVLFGIWLAVYSTRFVPLVVGRVGSAAVYLSSVFVQTKPSLSVIPTASSTMISFIPFGEATSTTSTNTVSTSTTPSPKKKTSAPTTAGSITNNTYPIAGTTTTVTAFSGLPDLIVKINAIGYLATTSANSFVASSTVPAGSRPAVSFTIKNIGTNTSGAWRFSAIIPTQTAYVYQSQPQQSLAPGDSIDYTLGFDQANKGVGQTISITANSDHTVAESDTTNNNASATITILGN